MTHFLPVRSSSSFAAVVVAAMLLAPRASRAQQPFGGQSPAPPPPAQPAETAPPRLLDFVPADYPPEARAAAIEGGVLLSLDIDEQGRVTAVSVLEGLGHGLDEAAVGAARRFRFVPARQGGRAVPARIRY